MQIAVPGGTVSGILTEGTRALLVLAHGAGADMRHVFMEGLAAALAEVGVGTLRYNFEYTERGSRRPDPEGKLLPVVRAAVATAGRELPLFAGGKSMGGRMTAYAQAREPLQGVRGLVFYGYPLHPPDNPGKASERAAPLAEVRVPMLFLQGDRDEFAPPATLAGVLAGLPTARLHPVPGGDHGFAVRGQKAPQVLAGLAAATRAFIDDVLA